jgi:hypothetical protein
MKKKETGRYIGSGGETVHSYLQILAALLPCIQKASGLGGMFPRVDATTTGLKEGTSDP